MSKLHSGYLNYWAIPRLVLEQKTITFWYWIYMFGYPTVQIVAHLLQQPTWSCHGVQRVQPIVFFLQNPPSPILLSLPSREPPGPSLQTPSRPQPSPSTSARSRSRLQQLLNKRQCVLKYVKHFGTQILKAMWSQKNWQENLTVAVEQKAIWQEKYLHW